MKRWILVTLLLCAGALVGRAVYSAARPVSEKPCTMAWLEQELNLTPEQKIRIEQLHAQSDSTIQKLRSEYAQCDKSRTDGARASCEKATKELIERVAAELNPEQRQKYFKLVAPCSRGGGHQP
jgi:hypothetical protein